MAKDRKTRRSTESGTDRTGSRIEVARADAAGSRSTQRQAADPGIRRMGPYETSYRIDFGYSSRETV